MSTAFLWSGTCLGSKALDEDAAGASAGLVCANGRFVRRLYLHGAPIQVHAIHPLHCCLHIRPANPSQREVIKVLLGAGNI